MGERWVTVDGNEAAAVFVPPNQACVSGSFAPFGRWRPTTVLTPCAARPLARVASIPRTATFLVRSDPDTQPPT